MGYGDALMATAEARALHARTGLPVAIGDGTRLRLSAPDEEIVAGNPLIVTKLNGQPVAWLHNYVGNRPYLDVARMRADFEACFPGHPFTMKLRDPRLPWRYTAWSVDAAGPGELHFTPEERVTAERRLDEAGVHGPFVVIEPHIKTSTSPNKAWGVDRYQQVADALQRRVRIVQVGPPGTITLTGATLFRTKAFRAACAIVSKASLYIGPEGGLHHAAAALGIPAIVIFGGFNSPDNTGYDAHVNLFAGDEPCGQRVPCGHCQIAMAAITPKAVIGKARDLL